MYEDNSEKTGKKRAVERSIFLKYIMMLAIKVCNSNVARSECVESGVKKSFKKKEEKKKGTGKRRTTRCYTLLQ